MVFFLFLFSFSTLSHAGSLVSYQTETGESRQALGQVLVKYKAGKSAAARNAVLRNNGTVRLKEISKLNIDVLTLPAGETLNSFINKLKQNPDVEYVEPNGIYRAFVAPNDTEYASQYALGSNYIAAEAAWDITLGNASVVIAVIDTGITLTHPDLSGNLWVNPAPSGNSGLNGTRINLDWNGNGDCTDEDPDNGPDQCASSDPTDDNSFLAADGITISRIYHGTRVSGMAAATTNNSFGMAGVARGCRIMAIKALNSVGAGSFEAIAEGIIYAVDNGASVINMSLGGSSGSQAVTDAVAYATSRNVVLVAAAGNSGTSFPVGFPATIPDVIAVGSVDQTRTISIFSQTGPTLDVVAPGEGIVGTFPPNTTTTGDGTSFACPMVAGIAALMRSANANLTPADVAKYIAFTATDLGPAGFDNTYGFGMAHAGRAVQAANSGTTFVSNPGFPSETFPYPNPFRPAQGQTTNISLPASMGTEDIKIDIITVAGEKIRTLNSTTIWDGKNDDGYRVASGLYFYYATTSAGNVKGKITVIK